MPPVIEVSRLSSASSFYTAVCQFLGIRCLSSSSVPSQAPKSSPLSSSNALSIPQRGLVFGTVDTKEPLFQIVQVASTPDRPLRTSHIVLSANSLDAVSDFHAAALTVHPRSAAVIGTRASLASDSATAIGAAAAAQSLEDSDVCARVTDFDGNTMEVAYMPASYSSYQPYYGGSPVSRHSDRVTYWSYDEPATDLYSPRSRSGSRYREMPATYDYYYYDTVSPSSSSSRYHGGSGRTATLRRSATSTSSASYEMPSSRHSPRESPKGGLGMNAAGMLGAAAVGVAAGAAITYSVMSGGMRSRSRSSRSREYDEATAVPSFQRRSTYPDAYPEYSASRYGSNEGMRARAQKESDDYGYEYDDGRGRYSSSRQYRIGNGSVHGSGVRSRSEASRGRAPLMISEAEIRSSNGSASGGGGGSGSYTSARHPPPSLPRRGSSFDYHTGEIVDRGDRESYVSASRSHRTVRGSGLPSTPPNASRSASIRQSTSRSGSYMSARNIPLPASGAGSSYGRWEDDARYEDDDRILYDDNDSVAPSDSISCVGSRDRGRHYR